VSAPVIVSMVIAVYRVLLSFKKVYINLITLKEPRFTKAVYIGVVLTIIITWFFRVPDTYIL
jgi:hypothetical protein